MKRYFIVIPKNEVTEEMNSILISIINSNDNNYIIGMVCNNVPSILNSYTILNKNEYYQLLEDEPELWVPEELR